jgi:hypothetical protein
MASLRALDARSWNLTLGRDTRFSTLGLALSIKESETCPCRNETRSGRADEGERGSVLKTQPPDHHRGEMKTNGERGVLNAMPSV